MILDMRAFGKVSAAALAAFAGLVLLSGCNGGKFSVNFRKKETVRQPVKVRVEAVGSASSATTKTYIGRVEASKSATVLSPFPAKLEKINVRQGQDVRANRQVAKVYSSTVDNALSSARATLRQAQDAYDRLQAVKDNGSVPQVKIVEVETALARAKAAFSSAQKAAYDCSVKAPFAGTVSEVFCEEGEDISIAQPIVKIVDLHSLEISISVPETEISSCSVGSYADVTVTALSDTPVRARLVRKGVDASVVAHSYDCRLSLETPLKNIMPGMICKVVFRSVAGGFETPVIPASVIRTDKTGRYVWTVSGGNVVEKKYVTTGDFAGKGVKILSGLEAGDRLIVDGAAKVSTGMKVEPVTE